MSEMEFAWDKAKSLKNEKKHGISFEEAKTVFFDENARLIPDPDHSENEDRYILLSLCSLLRTLVVCHCYREKGKVIRIISARKANKSEKRQYEDFKNA